MFEKETTDLLLKFLERKAKQAENEIEEKGVLSDENAIPLLLKTQFNHIAHLDSELSQIREIINKRFTQYDEKMERKFDKVDQRFNSIKTVLIWMGGAGLTGLLAILGLLITLLVKK